MKRGQWPYPTTNGASQAEYDAMIRRGRFQSWTAADVERLQELVRRIPKEPARG